MTREPARAGRTLLACVAVLALAGCASAKHDSGSAGRASATARPTSSPSSPSPTPSPTTVGTDLSACKDGTCVVKVTAPTKIPVNRRKFKVGTVRVVSIKRGAVSFTITASGTSTFNFGCDGDDRCDGNVVGGTAYSPAMERMTGHAGARITANRILITVVSVARGSAILRLSPV